MDASWLFPSNLTAQEAVPVIPPDGCGGVQATLDFMAQDAYIYGYPLVLLEITQRLMLAGGLQQNRFLNERVFPTPQYATIVRPNVDTLYSMAWLDLGREPQILNVPDTQQRYYLMELLDAWTNVFASVGTRTTGSREGTFAITGPEWNGALPEGVTRIESPTNTVWVIGRTQTNGPQDYPAVHAIQNQYRLMPLSCWGKMDPDNTDEAADGEKRRNINPADVVARMDPASFYDTMMAALERNPPWIADPEMDRKLAMLGLVPTPAFDFNSLPPYVAQALQSAAINGPGLLRAETVKKYARTNLNGWVVGLKGMGFYGADYLQRAMIAMTGIGANLPQDAVYGLALLDAAGLPLVGSNHYRLHFDEGQLPPVNAFWSVTVYNDRGYLVPNPIHRYAVSPHLNRLNYHGDGSLDIFIGNRPPGIENLTNWLPAPAGSFNLALRMYWPKECVLSGAWKPPALRRD